MTKSKREVERVFIYWALNTHTHTRARAWIVLYARTSLNILHIMHDYATIWNELEYDLWIASKNFNLFITYYKICYVHARCSSVYSIVHIDGRYDAYIHNIMVDSSISFCNGVQIKMCSNGNGWSEMVISIRIVASVVLDISIFFSTGLSNNNNEKQQLLKPTSSLQIFILKW